MRTFLVLSIPLTVGLLSSSTVWTQSRAGGSQPEQKVTPPEARYWMGATTGSGMLTTMGMAQGGRPSLGDAMRMARGGMSAGHRVELKLGTSLPPTGAPEAFHTMPPGAAVNRPIYLESPQPTAPGPTTPGPIMVPKGQITFYWGCGEHAGPGQPVVLTFDKLMNGENDPELQTLQGSVSAREVRKPSPSNSKTYGDWPHADRAKKNKDLQASFLDGSTLAGPHSIQGSYGPKIDFTLPADKTFMDPVQYTSTSTAASGAIQLAWQGVNRATGYSIGVMAPEKAGDDSANMIMWSSADRPATFIMMADLSPAEVTRLIGLKAVLPPTTSQCAIPAEVVKATKEGSMLIFTAFGDESTFIYPPRPSDPATTWDQEWFARVGFKSARMDMVSPQGVMDMRGAPVSTSAAPPTGAMSDEDYCRAQEAERQKKARGGGSGGGLAGRLGGRLGRAIGGGNKQAEEPVDPRCVPKK